MGTLGVGAILNIGSTLIDRLIPDRSQAAAAKAQLLQMQVAGDLDQIKGQIAVDQTEAASQSVFVAGWRPFVGWACGAAFIYAFIVQPMTQALLVIFHSNFDPNKMPKLDITEMLPVLFAMLGMGALRSWDKQNGAGNGS